LREIWPFNKSPMLLENGERFFERHGGKSVFIGRFVGPMRAIVPVVAGMLKMSHTRFFIANVTSGIGWAPAYMFPGFMLGVASLQFPPHVAMHYIMMFLLICIAGIIAWWLIKRCYLKMEDNIETAFAALWQHWKRKPKHCMTTLLQHHNALERHGQLASFFMLFVLCCLFLMLAAFIKLIGEHNTLNEMVYHAARNLHSPALTHFFVGITYLGEKMVLYPAGLILLLIFALHKQWRIASHWLALLILTAGAAFAVKFAVHAPRPTGIFSQRHGFAFPSGHATFSIAFYGFLAKLTNDHYQRRFRKPIYWCVATLVIFIGLSRVYLTAHWLTDVIGGFLLGTICLLSINMAFLRKPAKPFNPARTFAIYFLSIIVIGALFARQHIHHDVKNAALVWPTTTLNYQSWWDSDGDTIPALHTHAFGIPGKTINVLWAGNLRTITHNLLSQDWKIAHRIDWKNITKPVKLAKEMQSAPIILRKFQGKRPALILTYEQDETKPILLTLWNSHIVLTPGEHPLWVARLRYLHQLNTSNLASPRKTLQSAISDDYTWKISSDNKLLLIKPKG